MVLRPAEIDLSPPPHTPAEHWRQRPLRLLFVGRLEPVKGVDVLLDALVLLRDRGVHLQLHLIGRASPNQGADLDRRIRERGLGALLQRPGPIPRRDLAEHYSRCHLVVDGETGGLADALEQLDADRLTVAHLAHLAEKARQRGLQFNWEANVKALQWLITATPV